MKTIHEPRRNFALTEPIAVLGSASTEEKSVTFEVYGSFEELEPFCLDWDRLAEQTRCPVYCTYDWCKAWWRFYGESYKLRCYVFRRCEAIVGIVPVFIDCLKVAGFTIRIARLIASSCPPRVIELIVDPAYAEEVVGAFLGDLLKSDLCDLVSLGVFSQRGAFVSMEGQLRQICSSRSISLRRQGDGVHSVFCLPDEFPKYLNALSKNEKKNLRKYELRSLRKSFQVSVLSVSDANETIAEFQRFVPLHGRQWAAEGKPGHFGAWPNAEAYNSSLVQTQAKHGRTRFLLIKADEETIAAQYCYAFGDRLYWELPARAVGANWEKFSLGPSAVVTMIDSAIQSGLKEIEGGLGHYAYKVRLNAQEFAVYRYHFFRPTKSNLFKLKLLGTYKMLYTLVYQKLWARRLAPKLPMWFSRPYRFSWLRLDF
jgi:CelD/BcsL family acetyltransferase involved in cellulose biosynthesis